MCLILFGWDCHPNYKLVMAANRDEFYQRPTAFADFWDDYPDIVAGRDLQAGGTWLGINRNGRFAALTNYRDPFNHKHNAPSRGLLVQNYLTGADSPPSYIEQLDAGGALYNSFNLLLGNHEALWYYSNREKLLRQVQPGVHGLSNSLLNVPWPKVTKGTNALTEALRQEHIDVESLFSVLSDGDYPNDEELPDTGVGLDMERMLGPMFVSSREYDYGTRVSTVLLIDRSHRVQFWERSYEPLQAERWKQVYYDIPYPAAKSRLSDLPNIGKTMEKRLAAIGIQDIPTLMAAGSKETFIRLRKHEGDT